MKCDWKSLNLWARYQIGSTVCDGVSKLEKGASNKHRVLDIRVSPSSVSVCM